MRPVKAAKYEKWLTREGLVRIQGWARDGLILKQIAKNMGVSESTLRTWRDKFPKLEEALQQGKDSADREVENALFKSAIGFVQKIRKPVKIRVVDYDPKTGRKIRETETWQAVEEEIFVQPQVVAQIFWLKNRKPDQWREKNDLVVAPTNGVLESLLELERGGEG